MFKAITTFTAKWTRREFMPFRDEDGYHFERHIILTPFAWKYGSGFSVEVKDKVESQSDGLHKFVVIYSRMDYFDRDAPNVETKLLMRNLVSGDVRGIAAEEVADTLFFSFCFETIYKECFPQEYAHMKKSGASSD